jgi:hypothetical protein
MIEIPMVELHRKEGLKLCPPKSGGSFVSPLRNAWTVQALRAFEPVTYRVFHVCVWNFNIANPR